MERVGDSTLTLITGILVTTILMLGTTSDGALTNPWRWNRWNRWGWGWGYNYPFLAFRSLFWQCLLLWQSLLLWRGLLEWLCVEQPLLESV